ncbi:hypothetical protein T01_4926 [Trichinella spiralis]|uniref:Uncharacterized protein n=1 Tax=Trichinella spiralis TaxID=6334 RepID=A0A0V1B9Z2_TRISP|nr:hypothetical protein T01_4926 [Trichinella spiralis]
MTDLTKFYYDFSQLVSCDVIKWFSAEKIEMSKMLRSEKRQDEEEEEEAMLVGRHRLTDRLVNPTRILEWL